MHPRTRILTLMFVLYLCYRANCGNSNADWMSKLPKPLTQKPLNQLAIPGSHDTFSYSIKPSSGIVNAKYARRKWIPLIVKPLGMLGKKIMYRWARTQSLDITQQLQRGIRYLDCRVAWQPTTKSFFFVHGMYGAKALPILKEIRTFLEEHSKEVVLLDFNHLYDMGDDQHTLLLTELINIFGSKICWYQDIKNVSLSALWEKELQVIIFYDHVPKPLNCNTFWQSSSIEEPWANAASATQLISILDANYKTWTAADKFYVWSGVCTPRLTTILLNIGSSLKATFAMKVAPKFDNWITSKPVTTKQALGICIMDFVELGNFISDTINLNR